MRKRPRREYKPREEVPLAERWTPKTIQGREVKAGNIKDIKQLIEGGVKILEPEVVEMLVPGLELEYINIGQAKGKFGGGKRRAVRQTQKKTKEGSKLHFSTLAVVGNNNGYVGVGRGTAGETIPGREKAVRNAKTNLIEVARGCGSWECTCGEPHSIPFEMTGKCGSYEITLMPAPKGTGLCVDDDLKKILKLAGYKDVWSKAKGQSSQKINVIKACIDALKKGTRRRVTENTKGIIYGEK